MTGPGLFAQYAFPPNELGYCGPEDTAALLGGGEPTASVARQFDGAWPYLRAIATAIDVDDPLAPEVVRSYWVGGPALATVDAARLLARLRSAFTGQVTGLLDEVHEPRHVRAHHSFHVLVVYPWVRFLDRDPAVPLRVLQNCRIRWGTVQSVDDEYVRMRSRPLVFTAGALALGDPVSERVRWSRDGTSLTSAPAVGDTVTAHWDWVCDSLNGAERAALSDATHHTLALVHATRIRAARFAISHPRRGIRSSGTAVSSDGP